MAAISSQPPKPKQDIPDPLAFQLFLQYNRNKLCMQQSSTGVPFMAMDSFSLPPSDEHDKSCSEKRELFKQSAKRVLLTVTPRHNPSQSLMKHYRENMKRVWELTDQPTKQLFIELANEAQGNNINVHVPAHGKPTRSIIQPAKRESSRLFSQYRIDNHEILAKCPIVHSPLDREQSSKRSRTFSMCDALPSITGTSSSRPFKRRARLVSESPASSSNEEVPPGFVKLSGIKSLMGENDDDISTDELQTFLSQLDWNK